MRYAPPQPYAPPSANPQTPAFQSDNAEEDTASYRNGEADWRALQSWFATQTGDRRAGADFWAANRSKKGHKSCEEAGKDFAGDAAEFVGGCQEAKQHLDPMDAKRLADPEYRAGFNDEARRLPIVTVQTSEPAQPAISSSATQTTDGTFRCRDPHTNFVYERSEPCARGDIALSGPQLAPAVAAPTPVSTGDPLMDAVRQKLINNAIDVCQRTADLPKKISPCAEGPEKLVAQWEANRRSSTLSFRDLILDKDQLSRADDYGIGKSVIVRGVYIRALGSIDYLLAPGALSPLVYGRPFSSDNAMPLLLDAADRVTRSALLACREKYPPETFTGCSVILFGFVQKCSITMLLTNASHEEICIKVSDVTVDPRS
jgi:hypothetical protein